jgi:hypothetical protein
VHLETAARLGCTVAALVDGNARQLGYQGLDHATYLRVIRGYASQRATVAPNHEASIPLFDLRQTAQFV